MSFGSFNGRRGQALTAFDHFSCKIGIQSQIKFGTNSFSLFIKSINSTSSLSPVLLIFTSTGLFRKKYAQQ